MPLIEDVTARLVTELAWMPAWLVSLIILIAFAALGLVLHGLTVALVRRLRRRANDPFWTSLLRRARGPSRMAFVVGALSVGVQAAPMPAGWADLASRSLAIAFVVLVGWIAIAALDIATALYLRRFRIDVEDNLLARKHLTQMRILKRAGAFLIGLITIAVALMTIPGVRQVGVSLLAAGGAAGIIVGLALQPILTNLIAGVQIAMTQPIRLDDAVIVEGEWGKVEEITTTYVVVRLWDWRRMILPLTWFIQNPFQNWTRETASLIGTAMVYVDYEAPIAAMRAKLEAIAKASPLWDGQVVNLAVTDLSERTMQVRCLVSAKDAGRAFDLRCEVREKMVAWLQEEHPDALPRDRLDLETVEASAAGATH